MTISHYIGASLVRHPPEGMIGYFKQEESEMSYIETSKAAWEEAFDNRIWGWGTSTINEIGNVGTDIYDGKGIPLSYILVAEK